MRVGGGYMYCTRETYVTEKGLEANIYDLERSKTSNVIARLLPVSLFPFRRSCK